MYCIVLYRTVLYCIVFVVLYYHMPISTGRPKKSTQVWNQQPLFLRTDQSVTLVSFVRQGLNLDFDI